MALVKDFYSRRVIDYKLDKHRTGQLTLAALRQALSHRKMGVGLIFHADRSAEYVDLLLRNKLKKHRILSSMKRAKSVTDKAHMESFSRSMKTETIKGVEFNT